MQQTLTKHYYVAVECPNPAKHTGDTVSINIVLAAKHEQYLRPIRKSKVLKILALRTIDQNAR